MEKPLEFKYVTKTIIENSISISVKELMDALYKAGIPEEKWKDVEIETDFDERDTLEVIKVNYTFIKQNQNYDSEMKEYQLYLEKQSAEEIERKRLQKIEQESLDAKRAWKKDQREERIKKNNSGNFSIDCNIPYSI